MTFLGNIFNLRVIVLSQSEIDNAPADMVMDYAALYQLDEVPYTKYFWNGTALESAQDLLDDLIDVKNELGAMGPAVQELIDASINSQILNTPREVVTKGASYTLEGIDARNRDILISSSSAVVVTIPGTDVISIGSAGSLGIPITRIGTGQVVIQPTSGVTLLPSSTIVLDSQYATARVRPISTNTWLATIDGSTGGAVVTTGNTSNTAAPTVSGSAVQGQTLTATDGTWTNTPSITRQWYAAGSPINGATSSTYASQAGDIGKEVYIVVTGSVSGFSSVSVRSSNGIIVVAQAVTKPQNSVLPTISGSNTIGSTITVNAGSWTNSPTGYKFQRNLNGVNSGSVTDQAGATLGYILLDSDSGGQITYTVTPYNGSGDTTDPATTTPFTVATVPSGSQLDWVLIANEGATFDITINDTIVRWGTSATGTYFETTRDIGTYIANNAEFGNDPAPGADKWVWAWLETGGSGGGGGGTFPIFVNSTFLGMHWHRDIRNLSGAGPTVSVYPFDFGLHRMMSKEGNFRWWQINTAPGVYNWTDMDAMISRLPTGCKVELVIHQPPDFARDMSVYSGSPSPVASGYGFVPSIEDHYKTFLRALLNRYGAHVESIDPANEWNLLSSYTGNSADNNTLAGYAAGPVSALVNHFQWTKDILVELGMSSKILYLGSTTGASQIFSVIDRYPQVKTICNGAQIHGYEQTADNWGTFEPTDYLSVMRAGLDARGLSAWKLSDGEHGITGAGEATWWNTLIHLASLGWWNVGVFSGDDDGDGGPARGGDPINNAAVAAMYQDFNDRIAGRYIQSIDKSAAKWVVVASDTP